MAQLKWDHAFLSCRSQLLSEIRCDGVPAEDGGTSPLHQSVYKRPALGGSRVRQESVLCLHTEICGLTQDRRLSGGNPGGGEGGREALPALPCPLFPLSDVPLRPHLLPRHMGTINHCCDPAERPGLTRHSGPAIKTLFMILCLLLTDPEILSHFPQLKLALTTSPPRRAPPPIPLWEHLAPGRSALPGAALTSRWTSPNTAGMFSSS